MSAAVSDYLTKMHPGLPASGITVTVQNAGSTVPGGDLTTVTTGSSVSVQVDVQFDAVRWINGLPLLDGRTATRTTTTRRE